ncbi:MAG: lysophospholipid acyltransferase family protein [Thermoanaerobaculia bacterium]
MLYRALVVISAIGRRIPLPLGRILGRALGRVAWHVVRRERRKALANFAIAFPDWSERERRDAIRAMFRHFGMSLFEIAWLPNLDPKSRDETTDVEGIDRVLELIDSGRGVICITAHCGNWEWLSYVMGSYGRPVYVLQRERDAPEMNAYITELRARSGVRTIDRGSAGSARDMIQAIRKGGMLAFVVDQNIRTESVKIPFFGRPALTPIGPARFAVKTEAAVVAAVIERRPDGRHLARFLEPVYCKRGDDPVELTRYLTRVVEEQIRRAPEQWVWMHDRWRDRPKWDVGQEYGVE